MSAVGEFVWVSPEEAEIDRARFAVEDLFEALDLLRPDPDDAIGEA